MNTEIKNLDKRIISVVAVLGVLAAMFLYNWNLEAVLEAHTMPEVERVNIYQWVRMHKLEKPQLLVVAEQTGVNVEVVGKLLEEGKWQLLLELQGAYFGKVYTESLPSSIVTVSEYVVDAQGAFVDGTQIANVQNGDILVTKNSRFLGWRNGHVGLVVDADVGIVLEAVMLGTDTKFCSIEKWTGYPAFQVLRLKKREQLADAVAAYARERLVNVPYALGAGIGDRLSAWCGMKSLDSLKGSQCAHLVWYAYMQAGIDLDSDGGILVTPADIQESPWLEVVQSYGYG